MIYCRDRLIVACTESVSWCAVVKVYSKFEVGSFLMAGLLCELCLIGNDFTRGKGNETKIDLAVEVILEVCGYAII